MRIDLGDDEQPEIGLIALIDCIFFLLMFFMVATSFKHKEEHRKERQMPITLPRSSASLDMAQAAPDPLVIRVDRAGNVSIGEDGGSGEAAGALSVEALHERLRDEAARNPGRPVRIDGDANVAYQAIVRVLDLCQFEGLTNIAMHTRRAP
ncbi:biopolymer transporter ExbD [Massilia forsythiae]|uniref:Biopolymer transporter ExbD n=1 Tax=Massilia forsythiae TaxID=2728020 RepID=A0A7Z2ZR58_9BURK|nr:biopolymer transporter ExbD [Massilia forsythiae]QJD99110.1 biopolymer transporter ExbD [Massilia forsythiae]